LTGQSNIPADWDAWLESVGREASFTQTACWARISEGVNGCVPYVLEVSSAGCRVGGALFGHSLPVVTSPIQRARLSFNGTARGRLECFGGPVINSDHPAEVLDQLLSETDALASRLLVKSVHFGSHSTASWTAKEGVGRVFDKFGYHETPWQTALVDLTVPTEQLYAGFRQAARKGIRRCKELGVTVRECRDSDDYLEHFARPLFATRKQLGQSCVEDAAEKHWWDLDPGRHYRYFIAQDHQGQTLGTLGTYRWNAVVTEIMSERTRPAREANLPVQDILHWEAFLAHRELSDRLFDLAGFSPKPSDEKERGIRAFKEKWKGRVVAVPRFERTLLPARYRWSRAAYRWLKGNRQQIPQRCINVG
jgi:hypothetical protein